MYLLFIYNDSLVTMSEATGEDGNFTKIPSPAWVFYRELPSEDISGLGLGEGDYAIYGPSIEEEEPGLPEQLIFIGKRRIEMPIGPEPTIEEI